MTDVTNDLKLSMWDDDDDSALEPTPPAPAATSPTVLLRGTSFSATPARPSSTSPPGKRSRSGSSS